MKTINLKQDYYGNQDYGKRAFWISVDGVWSDSFVFYTDLNDWAEEKQKEGYTIEIEYDQKVKEGLIRPPTTKEEVMGKALHGHPDNASVQAARRIAIRRGWVEDIWES